MTATSKHVVRSTAAVLFAAGLIASTLVPVTSVAQSVCTPPPPGMVAWWPGDGNANDIQGTNHGALLQGASITAGKVQQAFSFDGIDDYVLVPDAPGLDLASEITIDAWIMPRRLGQDSGAPILAKGPGSTEAFVFDFNNGTNLRFVFRRADNVTQHYAVELSDWLSADKVNVWSHVAASYNAATGALKLYVNGGEAASASAPIGTLMRTNDDPVSMGGRRPVPSNPAYDLNFDAVVDEVEVFNRALAAAEIQAIYEAGSAGKCKVAPTNTPTATPIATESPTTTPTHTPVPAATATHTPVPAATATHTPVPAATATHTPVPAATATHTPTATAIALPTSQDQCKNGGWKRFVVFKNQGDCVSFVATRGRNSPAGGLP